MGPEHASATFGQYLKITLRLGRLHDTERERLSGNRQVECVVARDLQEYP